MATGNAPKTAEHDRLIVQSTPLAEAESTEIINYDNGDATIRTLVSVHKCPHGFRSRLGYHASLYLTKADGVERNIGYITAWRLSRPSGVNPNIDYRYCIDDWYHRRSTEYGKDSKNLARCFRAIYGPGSIDGDFYDRVVDEAKRTELRDDGHEVIFIQTIYVKWREDPGDEDTVYSGSGLAAIYLETYYRLLGGKILPAWFTLSGPVTYLLMPRLPSKSPLNEVWRHVQQEDGTADEGMEEKVEATLTEVFQRPDYGYKTYVKDVTVMNRKISVLGHVVKAEDTLSTPEDRLLLPAGG